MSNLPSAGDRDWVVHERGQDRSRDRRRFRDALTGILRILMGRAANAIAHAVRRERVAAVLSCLLAASCRPSTGVRRPREQNADMLAALAGHNRVRAVEADARLDYFHRDGTRDTATLSIVVRAPDAIRVRTEGAVPGWEFACGGSKLTYVDYAARCFSIAPCDADTLGSIVGVPLDPSGQISLAMGTTTVIASRTAAHQRFGDHGRLRIDLVGAGESQTIEIDDRDRRFDILESSTTTGSRDGWHIFHKDFEAVAAADGSTFRVPRRSRLQVTGGDDIMIAWEHRVINVDYPDTAFHLDPPAGYGTCVTSQPPALPPHP